MNEQKLLFKIAQECFAFINPKLNNYNDFNSSLSKVVKIKELENIQYNFDIELDNIIKYNLKSISARVFSEESGWFETSAQYDYKIIYDPFCNSSLASKSFREAAMGISLFTQDGIWDMSLILDYQSGIIGFVKSGDTTKFYQVQTLDQVIVDRHDINTLDNAWSVVTLESIEERSNIKNYLPLLSKVGRLLISSGHIYWLKLAMGAINIYVDPEVGEELYEMFAATIAQGAGCKVTDLNGNDFNPTEMLNKFENDKHYSFYPVAASSLALHNELLACLQGVTS